MLKNDYSILVIGVIVFVVIGNILLGTQALLAAEYGAALRGVSGICIGIGLGLSAKYLFAGNKDVKQPVPQNRARLSYGLFIVAMILISTSIYIDYF